MQPDFVQPDSAHIPESLIADLVQAATGDRFARYTVVHHDQFTNDLAAAHLEDGRQLMVKRGRYEWQGPRFRVARRASQLLRRKKILAPAPLAVPAFPQPLFAYWRIDKPTLIELWARTTRRERSAGLRSLGELVSNYHRVGFAGHGDLIEGANASLEGLLGVDLEQRLGPSVVLEWPEAADLVSRLIALLPAATRRAPAGGVLLHGDLHFGNVLADRTAKGILCRGLIDLDMAEAGPPEKDLARLAVMHTDLFGMPIDGDWLSAVLSGYGKPLDDLLFSFFKVYHLVDLGAHSARMGHHIHARSVAIAARHSLEEVVRLA